MLVISISLSCSSITFASKPKLCNSFINILNYSGTLGLEMFSPLTIASMFSTRPTVSSNLESYIFLVMCMQHHMLQVPIPPSHQTLFNNPNRALPPSGCCVTSEYGPVERACNLSSTMCAVSTCTLHLLKHGYRMVHLYVHHKVQFYHHEPYQLLQLFSMTSSSFAPSNTGDAT